MVSFKVRHALDTTEPLIAGHWPRFERYELREGCIAPVVGAKAQFYEPWSHPERLYKSLVKIGARPIAQLHLPTEQPELVGEVLDWCNRYGLLGTLYHRLVMVTFWPRWARLEFADGKPRDIFMARQDTVVQLSGSWLTASTQFGPPISKVQLGAALSAKELRSRRAPHSPGALVRDIDGSVIREEPLEKTWASYFPDVPPSELESHDYPSLGTEEFWRSYGEPISEIVQAAWLLANGIEAIVSPRHPNARALGAQRLTQLASCSCPQLSVERNDRMRQRWAGGSLLSMLALMAMEDIAQDVLGRCETCGTLFRSDAYQAQYCSERCRHTMQKRRYRARARKRPKGRSPRRNRHGQEARTT